MADAFFKIPVPVNEPILSYAPGTSERAKLQANLNRLLAEEIEIPLMIGGKEVRTGNMGEVRLPHDHNRIIARYHKAGPTEVEMAIAAAGAAWREWQAMAWHARAAVFLRAAEILVCRYHTLQNAVTMLGQSKTPHQSEIDAVCETADFWRFNPYFMETVMQPQPGSPLGMWNMVEQRALEGFVFAVSPFNFTSIAANLPSAPAMMGNTVVWKPASSGVYPAHLLMRIYNEAGLPPGVINLVMGSGAEVGNPVLAHQNLAGVHFTGSTEVFRDVYRMLGQNISHYKSYPRVVGETGGKDFLIAHASADIEALVTAMMRGAFEYQGQKCSALSRAYIPDTLWPAVSRAVIEQAESIKMGDVSDFTNFMGAVIDAGAFQRISSYIEYARASSTAQIIAGGQCDDRVGYFIRPTVVQVTDPRHRLMEEEIFGPVLTVYVYPEKEYAETLRLCDVTSPYGLTGSVFANDRLAIQQACTALRYAAGNFYINDKPTGAVVGQQPFGGARASGTNDKAGAVQNLLRWVSPRTVKETFCPPREYRYPYMMED